MYICYRQTRNLVILRECLKRQSISGILGKSLVWSGILVNAWNVLGILGEWLKMKGFDFPICLNARQTKKFDQITHCSGKCSPILICVIDGSTSVAGCQLPVDNCRLTIAGRTVAGCDSCRLRQLPVCWRFLEYVCGFTWHCSHLIFPCSKNMRSRKL